MFVVLAAAFDALWRYAAARAGALSPQRGSCLVSSACQVALIVTSVGLTELGVALSIGKISLVVPAQRGFVLRPG